MIRCQNQLIVLMISLSRALLSDASDRTHWHSMVPAVHQSGGANAAPLFELSHCRYPGEDWALVETGPWPSLISRVLVSPKFPADLAISLDVSGARATEVGLRVTPSRLVSLARCCCGGFLGCHPTASLQSVFRCPLSSFRVSVDC